MLSILQYILLLPPTSPGSLHISSTSHSISFPLYISASPSQYLSVSFTCSLSCYILPSLWGWQSHIRHVIRREMWESGRGKLGVAIEWCYWPSSPLHWPAVTLASSPSTLRFIFFTAGCQWHHSTRVPVYPNTRHTAHLGEVSLKTTCCISRVHPSILPTASYKVQPGIHSKILTVKTQKVKWRVFTGAEQILPLLFSVSREGGSWS